MNNKRKIYFITLSLFVFFVSVFLYIGLFRQNYLERISEIENAGLRLKGIIDYGMDIRSYSIHSMKLLAEDTRDKIYTDYLNRNLPVPISIQNDFSIIPEKNGYTMNIPNELSPYDIGRLTGIGNIPREDDAAPQFQGLPGAVRQHFSNSWRDSGRPTKGICT